MILFDNTETRAPTWLWCCLALSPVTLISPFFILSTTHWNTEHSLGQSFTGVDPYHSPFLALPSIHKPALDHTPASTYPHNPSQPREPSILPPTPPLWAGGNHSCLINLGMCLLMSQVRAQILYFLGTTQKEGLWTDVNEKCSLFVFLQDMGVKGICQYPVFKFQKQATSNWSSSSSMQVNR